MGFAPLGSAVASGPTSESFKNASNVPFAEGVRDGSQPPVWAGGRASQNPSGLRFSRRGCPGETGRGCASRTETPASVATLRAPADLERLARELADRNGRVQRLGMYMATVGTGVVYGGLAFGLPGAIIGGAAGFGLMWLSTRSMPDWELFRELRRD